MKFCSSDLVLSNGVMVVWDKTRCSDSRSGEVDPRKSAVLDGDVNEAGDNQERIRDSACDEAAAKPSLEKAAKDDGGDDEVGEEKDESASFTDCGDCGDGAHTTFDPNSKTTITVTATTTFKRPKLTHSDG